MDTALSAIAVSGSTLYVGTGCVGVPSGCGVVTEVPLLGGATRTLPTSQYTFGGFAFDASRIYYARTTSKVPASGTMFLPQGLVAEDLGTGHIQDVPSPQSLTGFTATAAKPGAFWLGGPVQPLGLATALYHWDPQTDANSTLATGADLQGLATDGTSVYWADTGNQTNTIYAAPVDGGPQGVLANVPWVHVRGGVLGLSRTDVVFASDGVPGSVAIEAVPKAGGPVQHVITADVLSAWVDDEYFYWSETAHQGTLLRVQVSGGTPETIWDQPAPGYIQSLAFDECNVYIGLQNIGLVYVRSK